MSTTLGFGTENVVFVPKGRRLGIFDVYRWRLTEIDVLHSSVCIRPHAAEAAEMRIQEAVQHLMARKKKTKDFASAAEGIKNSLHQNLVTDSLTSNVVQMVSSEMTFWVRLTDKPAESFFSEDYEEAEEFVETPAAIPVFGSMHFSALEELEIPFPSAGKQAAFDFLLPNEDGLNSREAPLDEPLPLINEYCGAGGVSANGWSVNLDLRASVQQNKSGCVPIRKLAGNTFATLYFTQSAKEDYQVTARIKESSYGIAAAVLFKSRFETIAEGSNYLIFKRDGDVIHLYYGLEGKESAGTGALPPFMVAASAGGSLDPEPRSELVQELEKILSGANR